VTIECDLARDTTSATSSSVIAKHTGGHSATTIPTAVGCAAARFAAMVAAMPAQNAAHGPAFTRSLRWRRTQMTAADPDDDERGQKHPIRSECQPRRHHRIPVFGDDIARVTVARHRRGTTDNGQGDNSKKARPDSRPPLPHG
jgi:hypothetical protein